MLVDGIVGPLFVELPCDGAWQCADQSRTDRVCCNIISPHQNAPWGVIAIGCLCDRGLARAAQKYLEICADALDPKNPQLPIPDPSRWENYLGIFSEEFKFNEELSVGDQPYFQSSSKSRKRFVYTATMMNQTIK